MPNQVTNTRTVVEYTVEELAAALGLKQEPLAVYMMNGKVVFVVSSSY